MQQAYNRQVTSHNWGMLALRGLLAIAFGLVALFLPGIALLAFIIVFAVYAIFDGALAISAAIRGRATLPRWGWVLFEGIVSVAAGILAFFYPGITALVLLYIVAAWAILTGVLQIIAAITLREQISYEWLLGLAGVLSIVFGIVLFLFPGAGLLSLLWMVGIYSIIFGALYIIRAFQLRSANPAAPATPAPSSPA